MARSCFADMEALVHRLQYVVAAGLLVIIMAMSPALVVAASGHQNFDTSGSDLANSPNAVTRVFANTLSTTAMVANKIDTAANNGARTMAIAGTATVSGLKNGGQATLNASVFAAAHTVGAVAYAARGTAHGAALAASLPIKLVHRVTHLSASSVISPAEDQPLPTITPVAASYAVQERAPTIVHSATTATNARVIWPLRGNITTYFGVPEPPYEPIHTGLDISDGKPSGVSPIHAFRAGTVIAVIHERIRLGNEVVIDHGHGVTSVYGHLYSTTVRVGQAVTTSTVVGYEGSTGVSTGPHLHFEIHINGVPKNPLNYIPGHP